MDSRKLVTIKSFNSELDAQVAQQHLKSHGVEALITKDDGGGMRPWLQGIQGVILQVLEKDSAKAEKVLKAMKV